MELYKRPGSPYWWTVFGVNGRVFRKSTGQRHTDEKGREVNKKRAETAALAKMAKVSEDPKALQRSPKLEHYAEGFRAFIETNQELKPKSRLYYLDGLRLLLATDLRHLKLDRITPAHVATVEFRGSGSYANTAIRTLRRLLNHAHAEGKLAQVPKLKNRAEVKRKLCLDDDTEALLLPHLEPNTRDAIVIMRDCGSRPSEILAMKWEYINWQDLTYQNPEGKTEAAARVWLLSDRMMNLLSSRHIRQNTPRSGFVFPSKTSASGHLTHLDYTNFCEARRKLGLSPKLVPYSARHDFGTQSMIATGNPGVTAGLMGHSNPSITLNRYNHPPKAEAERIRALVNSRLCTKSAHSENKIVNISANNRKQSTNL